jgi:Ca2+-binding EF-hand superfamily protein
LYSFLAQQLEDSNDKERLEMDQRWAERQKVEFHEMDENNDGVLSRDELLVYITFILLLHFFDFF